MEESRPLISVILLLTAGGVAAAALIWLRRWWQGSWWQARRYGDGVTLDRTADEARRAAATAFERDVYALVRACGFPALHSFAGPDGSCPEMDVLARVGNTLLVIECKNWSGQIDRRRGRWLQTRANGERKGHRKGPDAQIAVRLSWLGQQYPGCSRVGLIVFRADARLDPRLPGQCLTLSTLPEVLLTLASAPGQKDVGPAWQDILNADRQYRHGSAEDRTADAKRLSGRQLRRSVLQGTRRPILRRRSKTR